MTKAETKNTILLLEEKVHIDKSEKLFYILSADDEECIQYVKIQFNNDCWLATPQIECLFKPIASTDFDDVYEEVCEFYGMTDEDTDDWFILTII